MPGLRSLKAQRSECAGFPCWLCYEFRRARHRCFHPTQTGIENTADLSLHSFPVLQYVVSRSVFHLCQPQLPDRVFGAMWISLSCWAMLPYCMHHSLTRRSRALHDYTKSRSARSIRGPFDKHSLRSLTKVNLES
jgi:hypothetical protein